MSETTTTTDGELALDEAEERQFHHGATGYGVELYGGTAEDRIAVLREKFKEPLATVDCREADTSEAVIDMALAALGVDEDKINRLSMGSFDLRKTINETEQHFAILELDSLGFKEQRSLARTMKSVAEGVDHDEIMLGFTSSMGGAVVSAEPDLSARIRSWQVGSENDEYGPLSGYNIGDEIETSARATPMEIASINRTPTNTRTLTATNHHGEYELRQHMDGSVTMYAGEEVIRNVEVDHAE